MYPEYTQLKKGDYTVRLMLRQDSQDVLDKMTALPLVGTVEMKGDKRIEG